MRKRMLFLFIISMLFYICFSVTNMKTINANTIVDIEHSEKGVLSDYVKRIDTMNKNIDLLGKTALDQKDTSKENQKQHIDDIDFMLVQINEISQDLKKDYQANINNTEVDNYISSMSAIISNYKFALSQLKQYLQTKDYDVGYKSLGTFYIIMNSTNAQLNNLKIEISTL